MADYIEREATVNLLQSLGSRDYRREKGTIQEAIKMVSCPEYTLSCDVEPVRRGRWEEIRDPYGKLEGWMHKECGREVKRMENFCPSCGAKMDLEG